MLTLWSVWVLTPQYSDGDTILSKEHCLSDETLNRGPDSLWSLKNPMTLLVKSRGVTPVSWPNSLHWPLSIMAS